MILSLILASKDKTTLIKVARCQLITKAYLELVEDIRLDLDQSDTNDVPSSAPDQGYESDDTDASKCDITLFTEHRSLTITTIKLLMAQVKSLT